MSNLAIKVRPSVEKHVKRGHPWIYGEAITKISQSGAAGDIAVIFEQRRNRVIGVGLYDPYSPIRIKLLHNGPAQINGEFFEERLAAAFAKREVLLHDGRTNGYRLVFGENDGLPGLIVDVYAGVVVVKLYSFIWFPYVNVIFPKVMELANGQQLVLRLSRQLQKHPELLGDYFDGQVLMGQLEDENVIFKEHDVLFSANVIKGHKTGFFLDHRHNRHQLGMIARGRTVLDVFSYAGGFSVHALVGGADHVTSLDISAQALDLAKANAELNGIAGRHECLAEDAFTALERFAKEGRQFGMVIVDPPSFAKSDRQVDKALKAYDRLAKLAASLVEPDGILFLASCSSRVTAEAFFETSVSALRSTPYSFVEFDRTFHDVDHPTTFPEGAYLKSLYLKRE